MQWTVQVIVVLLNVAWIFFFLQPDPFSVFVQRRSSDSSDEEMLFRQFCIQPHPDMNWTSTVHSANITSNKTNSTNTTAEAAIGPDDCCFKFYPRRIKKDLIRSYYLSDHRCSNAAVILVTQKSRHICADPSLSWVDGIMKYLDEKSF